jgi:transcriptional regulator with XRE-family HTH domain
MASVFDKSVQATYLAHMGEIQTTGRRREVGAELKRIRKQRGWAAYRVAERLGWTASAVSRSEAGKRSVTPVDAGHYLGMCGAPDDELQRLLKLINEPDNYRLQLHEGRIADQLRTLIFLETTAAEMYIVEPIYIPGLLQTADYARAVFRETGIVEPDLMDGYVQIRMSRHAVLTGKQPPRCVFFVHENALRVPVGNLGVMNEQLLHLLFLGDRPECVIRVIPLTAGVCGMAAGSFHIFRYKEDPPVVYLGHETTSEFLENDDEMAHYERILKRIANVALDGPQSREFLATLASDYERQGDARHGTGGLAQE